MYHIAIISASVRTNRKSHRVALFFQQFIANSSKATAEILDLKAYNFPIFEERLSHMPNPAADVLNFAEKIKAADGIIIVTPEYNGGYPASLKNAIDLLYTEWRKRPIAFVAVSNGVFGGSQVLTSLVFTMAKIGATIVPNMYRVGDVEGNYNEDGSSTNPKVPKIAQAFFDDLCWYIEAKKRMEAAAQPGLD